MRRKVVFWVCFVVLLAAVGVGIGLLVRDHRQNEKDEELRKQVEVSVDNTEDGLSAEQESVVQIPVDFDELQKQNADIYAWIRIPDTPIDYPILQKIEEDDYYLNRTVDGKTGLPGSIMTEYSYNPTAFRDPVTVVYGHNMLNDSFFSHLVDYQDEEFREAHKTIEVYTSDHIYTYQVFAAVTYDNRHILDTYDCDTKEGYQAFLDSLSELRYMPTWIEDPLTVTTDDRIIVLSTCNGNAEQRFLVGAVLVNEQ